LGPDSKLSKRTNPKYLMGKSVILNG
jgi:hypothetical protein